MDLIDAMYEGLTGRAPTGDNMTFGSLLDALTGVAGSGAAAARLIGVSPTTLYRWRRGTQKPKTGAGVLARAIRRASLPADLESDIRKKRKTMRIKGTVTISKDTRPRTLNVGAHIPARKMGNIISAWLAADDDRASRLLWRAIDTHYVQDVDIEIERVTFE